jgi:hypothetical protein
MPHHQNAGQSHNTEIANKYFKTEAEFKYLWRTVTGENYICEEITRRLNSGNACCH